MTGLGQIYDKSFFDAQVSGSLASARVYLAALFEVGRPASVADLGCGRGAWLAACQELGVPRLVGFDGEWASTAGLVSERIEFHPRDLNLEVTIPEAFDLAMSLEVAEHVEPKASDTFHRSLTRLSGAILFSAAYTGQPGANHINTRPHSFWAEKFAKAGYDVFDFFRPRFWGDSRVEAWYRQNAFLYVKADNPLYARLLAAGHRPMVEPAFVDCVHPMFYSAALDELARLQGLQAPASGWRPGNKLGRNDPCSCGSGKKFKHCHGKNNSF